MPCSLVELSEVSEEHTDSISIVEEERPRFGILIDSEDRQIKLLRNAAKHLLDYMLLSSRKSQSS
jgi:hypothetical protein